MMMMMMMIMMIMMIMTTMTMIYGGIICILMIYDDDWHYSSFSGCIPRYANDSDLICDLGLSDNKVPSNSHVLSVLSSCSHSGCYFIGTHNFVTHHWIFCFIVHPVSNYCSQLLQASTASILWGELFTEKEHWLREILCKWSIWVEESWKSFRPQDILLSHLKTLLGCMCCTSEVSMAGATFSQQNWRGNSKSIRVLWDFQLPWCSVQWWWWWWWCLSSFGSKTMCHAINAGRTLASKCLGNDHFGSWMRYFGTKRCPRSKLVYKNASNIIKLQKV